jgi:hypothetical protein
MSACSFPFMELSFDSLNGVYGGDDDVDPMAGVDQAVQDEEQRRLAQAPIDIPQNIEVPPLPDDMTNLAPPTAESLGVEVVPHDYTAADHEAQARSNLDELSNVVHTETGTMYMDPDGGGTFHYVDAATNNRTFYEPTADGSHSTETNLAGGVTRETTWGANGTMHSAYVDEVGAHDVNTDAHGVTVHELVRHDSGGVLERTTAWTDHDADGREITSRIVEDGHGGVTSEFKTPTEHVAGAYSSDGERTAIMEKHSDGVSIAHAFSSDGERTMTTVHGADMTPFKLTADQAHALATGSGDDGVLGSIPDAAHAALAAHQNGDHFELTARQGGPFVPAHIPSVPGTSLPPGVHLTNVPGLTLSDNPPTASPVLDAAHAFMLSAQAQGATGTNSDGTRSDLTGWFRLGQTVNPVFNAAQRIGSTWTGHDPAVVAPWLAQVGVVWGAAGDLSEGKNPLDNLIKSEDKAMSAVYTANWAQAAAKWGIAVTDAADILGPTMSKLSPSLIGTAGAVGTLALTNYTQTGRDLFQSLNDAGVVVLPAFAGGPLGSAVVTGMMRQAAGYGYIMTEDRIHRLDDGMRAAINDPNTDDVMRDALTYARQTGDYRDMVQMGTDKEGNPILLNGKTPNEASPWQLAVNRVRDEQKYGDAPRAGPMPDPNVITPEQLAMERLTMRYAEEKGYYGQFGLPATYNSHSYNSNDIRTGFGSYRNALTQAYSAALNDIRTNGVDLLQHYGYVQK